VTFAVAATQGLVVDHLPNAENLEWSSFKPIVLLTRTPLLVVARGNLKDAHLANIIEQASQYPTTVGRRSRQQPGADVAYVS